IDTEPTHSQFCLLRSKAIPDRRAVDSGASNMRHLLPYTCDLARAMIFVDGENLAIRYVKGQEERGGDVRGGGKCVSDMYAWTKDIPTGTDGSTPAVMRKYYYTAVQGDEPKICSIEKDLKELGFEAPRVFKKEKGKPSKRVDITLATDMLLHATRKHYDLA